MNELNEKEPAGSHWIAKVWNFQSVRCVNPECRHRRHAPLIFRRHVGIAVDREWCCGPECLENYLLRDITSVMSAPAKQEIRPPRRMPLGLLLVSRGVLSSEQLATTLQKQQAERLNIGDAAQQLGFVSPEQVTAAVAAQWSCPVFPLAGRSLSLPIHVPLPVLEAFEMLPVYFVPADRRLTIGFVKRVEYQILSTVERITGCDSVPCFITAPEYCSAIQQAARSVRENEMYFDRPMHAAEVARMSRNYISQLGGKAVRFGMCREYVWIRIWNSRHETDLVFRVQPG